MASAATPFRAILKMWPLLCYLLLLLHVAPSYGGSPLSGAKLTGYHVASEPNVLDMYDLGQDSSPDEDLYMEEADDVEEEEDLEEDLYDYDVVRGLQVPVRRSLTSWCSENGGGSGGCFPGSATVIVEDRGTIPVSELQHGDRVLSISGDGGKMFDEVYFFGHKDQKEVSEFVSLQIKGPENCSRILELTPKHFMLVHEPKGVRAKYAKEVKIGDVVTVLSDSWTETKGVVSDTNLVLRKGLFNPYTKGGSIVVNLVLASAHSDWVLDEFIPADQTSSLPAIYQTLFKPLYWLHKVVGAKAMASINHWIITPRATKGDLSAVGLAMYDKCSMMTT